MNSILTNKFINQLSENIELDGDVSTIIRSLHIIKLLFDDWMHLLTQ